MLREGDAEPRQGTEPQPGLVGLPDLVERVRDAGLPVALSVEGEPRRVDAGVDVSAYRIVQEALTNVVRHAGPVPTSVWVRWEPDSVSVAVEDGGSGGGAARIRAGRGLVGIRERVGLLGGELTVGPVASGGFAVRARLPTDAGATG